MSEISQGRKPKSRTATSREYILGSETENRPVEPREIFLLRSLKAQVAFNAECLIVPSNQSDGFRLLDIRLGAARIGPPIFDSMSLLDFSEKEQRKLPFPACETGQRVSLLIVNMGEKAKLPPAFAVVGWVS